MQVEYWLRDMGLQNMSDGQVRMMEPRRFKTSYPSNIRCAVGPRFCGSRAIVFQFHEFYVKEDGSFDNSLFSWIAAAGGPFVRADANALGAFNETVCNSTKLLTGGYHPEGKPPIPDNLEIGGFGPWRNLDYAPASTNM